MKTFLIIVTLICASQTLLAANSSRPRGTTASWSLLYGYSQNVNNQNYKPGGAAYKLQLGTRWDNNIESNFFARYTSQADDITYSSIDGKIKRNVLTGGVQFGYWFFSILKLHAGYAFHITSNDVSGSYSSSQVSTINSNYGLANKTTKGLFAGADLALLQGTSFQLFANYDYYHINHADAHDWEGMLGIRFYPGPSSGGSSSSKSLFTRLFDWMLTPSK
jgi:hypothetical protein